jgi:hypothetical protein
LAALPERYHVLSAAPASAIGVSEELRRLRTQMTAAIQASTEAKEPIDRR